MTDAVPQLSICIPTYNRGSLLREALSALVAQEPASLLSEVEILISDNASTDSTGDVLSWFQAKHSNLRLSVVCQKENIGMDRNILGLVHRACGEYVWIISDDDILLPGALSTLLRWIETYPGMGAFSLNARPFHDYPEEQTAPFLALGKDTQFLTSQESLQGLREWITFISIIAFRRDLVSRFEYEDKVGSTLISSYLFVDVLAADAGLWVSREPFIALRAENSGGYNFFQVFVTNFAALMEYAETRGVSQQATQAILLRHLRTYICQNIKIFKLRGMIGGLTPNYRDAIQRLWRVYRWHPVFLFEILPLLFLPTLLVSRVYPLYQKLRRSGTTLASSELQ